MTTMELDLTPEEKRRLDGAAARQHRTAEEVASKLIRQHIYANERTGEQVAFGPYSADTREMSKR